MVGADMGPQALPTSSGNSSDVPALRRFSREGRILGVLLAIGVMAYADLDMTLAYATNVGMGEGNPVARAVMSAQSPALVVVYKLACTVFGLAILYRFRKSRLSEPAAWAMLLVMGWLMLRWSHYNAGIAASPSLYVDAAMAKETHADAHPEWIMIGP